MGLLVNDAAYDAMTSLKDGAMKKFLTQNGLAEEDYDTLIEIFGGDTTWLDPNEMEEPAEGDWYPT